MQTRDIRIREMRLDDIEQVAAIEKDIFSGPWSENGFFSFLIRDDTLFLVAEEAERILGYCGAALVLDEADLVKVAVRKEAQNQGIGRRLLDMLLARSQKAGVARIFLEVRTTNAPAIHLYEKVGFIQEGLRKNYYEEIGEDALIMKKDLQP